MSGHRRGASSTWLKIENPKHALCHLCQDDTRHDLRAVIDDLCSRPCGLAAGVMPCTTTRGSRSTSTLHDTDPSRKELRDEQACTASSSFNEVVQPSALQDAPRLRPDSCRVRPEEDYRDYDIPPSGVDRRRSSRRYRPLKPETLNRILARRPGQEPDPSTAASPFRAAVRRCSRGRHPALRHSHIRSIDQAIVMPAPPTDQTQWLQ